MNKVEVKIKWIVSHFIKTYFLGCKPTSMDDLKVLYLSNNFVVVNKGCDIAINSDSDQDHPITIATQLNYRFPHLADPSVKFGFRFCHRLDYSTSGVLAIALNKKAAQQSFHAFSNGKTDKYYLALLHDHVQENSIIMSQSIGNDNRPEFSHKMCSSDKEYCSNPKWSISKLTVLQRGFYNEKPATKVMMKLVTGRRHQLRVHCHELGHTIVGDFTYSNKTDIFPYRMFLHSYRLVLPCDMEKLDIVTEDPFSENEPMNKWCPTETVHELNTETFSIL